MANNQKSIYYDILIIYILEVAHHLKINLRKHHNTSADAPCSLSGTLLKLPVSLV